MEQLSFSDPLTGLSNRRHFDRQARQEFERALQRGTALTVAIIDVDYFKRVNDNYGHDVGDRCLIAIAEVIHSEVRRPADVVVRFGGEEMAVLLPDCDRSGARAWPKTSARPLRPCGCRRIAPPCR